MRITGLTGLTVLTVLTGVTGVVASCLQQNANGVQDVGKYRTQNLFFVNNINVSTLLATIDYIQIYIVWFTAENGPDPFKSFIFKYNL